MKIDAKFEEKLTCGLKNDVRDLVNFRQTTQKSKNLHFDELLLSKVYKIAQLKSTVELCVMILNSNAKFEEKMNCGFKNDMKNLVNVHPRTQKL